MSSSRLRLALFIAAAVVQLAVAGGAILRSELALRTGETFRFRIQPVDPVDAFRGRYVAIRMAVDSAPVAEDLSIKPGRWVFIPLEVDGEGYATFGSVALEPPDHGAYLRLRAGGVYADENGRQRLSVTATPFGRFYMDEDLAPEAERAVRSGPRDRREASITVRVRRGSAVLEGLFIEGVEIHEWLAANATDR